MKRDRREITMSHVRLAHARDALQLIADIAEGSTTANSLPHIAKIARQALTRSDPTINPRAVDAALVEALQQDAAGDDMTEAQLRNDYDNAPGRRWR